MPELPEVEVVRRGLRKRIVNKKIIQVKIYCDKSFQGQITEVIGKKVLKVERRGKAILIKLSAGKILMVHLRMTGQLIYDQAHAKTEQRFAAGHPSENFIAELPNKQTRVEITFDEGVLYFNDQRKFGFIKVLDEMDLEQESFIAKLAKEPWDMTEVEFYRILQRHARAPIKAVILDQQNIAGLGNIYADEALFMTGIHPATLAGKLTCQQAGELLKNAGDIMQKSVDAGGSTMATYVKVDGTRGDYLQKFAQVFRREGEPCRKCGTKIVKIRCAGRGTHYCPQCQKELKT